MIQLNKWRDEPKTLRRYGVPFCADPFPVRSSEAAGETARQSVLIQEKCIFCVVCWLVVALSLNLENAHHVKSAICNLPQLVPPN